MPVSRQPADHEGQLTEHHHNHKWTAADSWTGRCPSPATWQNSGMEVRRFTDTPGTRLHSRRRSEFGQPIGPHTRINAPSVADGTDGGREVQHLMILALRILRSSADTWTLLSSLGERARSGQATPRLEDVVKECLAVIDRRALSGHRFGTREIRRYQREVTQHVPDSDAEVEVALSILPDRARTVLILHDVEALRLAEIAAILDITTVAARWYLHRARSLVRLQLQLDHATP